MAGRSSDLRYSLLLLLAAAIWGFAFVAQRSGMEHLGPFTFNGLRFLLGGAVLLPLAYLTRGRNGGESSRTPLGPRARACLLALVGVVLFIASVLQQVGLVYTTAGKAGFITGLYMVIIPLLGLLLRQRVRLLVWIGAIVAVGGLYLLAGFEGGGIGLGDGLVLAGAFGWAVHVQLVSWLVRRIDPIRISVVQTAVCGALSLAVAAATEPISLAGIRAAVPALVVAGFLSVGVAYTLQVIAQRHVDPSRVGILVSLEAVFAVFGGWLLLRETVSAIMLVGAALMLLGMILSQLPARRKADRKLQG